MLNTQKTKPKATLIFKNYSRLRIIVYNCRIQYGTEQLWKLWSPYGIGETIIFLACGFFLLSFFHRLISAAADWMSTILRHNHDVGRSANLECRSEMCCKRLAGNTGRKNDAKNCHLTTIAQLCRVISSQLRHISTIGKNLLSSNITSTCPYSMVNFGPLTAEINWRVWGTPSYFNGYRILAALLHGSQVVGVSQTAALNRGRHLCSAGRPSRWALAHILVV